MIRKQFCPVCERSIPEASVPAFPLDVDDRAVPGEEALRPEQTGSLPFCSARCRRIDLFRWLDGRYSIVEELTTDSLLSAESKESDLYESGDVDC